VRMAYQMSQPHIFRLGSLENPLRSWRVKKVHGSVVFWVFTSRGVYEWLKNCEMLKDLTDSRVMVFYHGCSLQYPHKTWHFIAVMTNSATYCYSQTGFDVAYGSLEECLDTAAHGKIGRRDSLWRKYKKGVAWYLEKAKGIFPYPA